MCGILLVKSSTPISKQRHLAAFERIQSRGPDFSRYVVNDHVFAGQSVLHITGNRNYYNQSLQQNFLAYNGEIYNYREFGPFENDIEFVDYAANTDLKLFKQAWGPWAWGLTDGENLVYASDPQGEKCLYQYNDGNILIVSSEVAAILEYIDPVKIRQNYSTRHWCMPEDTPWHGISKIQPGHLYVNGDLTEKLDSIFDWVRPTTYKSLDHAQEEFDYLWDKTLRTMTPNCNAGLCYSGGIDSNIILKNIPGLTLYSTNMTGKDPIVDCIQDFLTDTEQHQLHVIHVDEMEWAQAFESVLQRTQMPVQSWSFVGQWIINSQCQERVLFTGVGADELFGGYSIYSKLNFQTDQPTSPYSQGANNQLWVDCLNAYDGHAGQAQLLMDFIYQVSGCDARGIDVIAGAWGIEARNPFMARPIVEFALGLPFFHKVSDYPKPILIDQFTRRWSPNLIKQKKGFSGHCNDSLPYLNLNIDRSGTRDQIWHQAVIESFYSNPMLPKYQTTLE